MLFIICQSLRLYLSWEYPLIIKQVNSNIFTIIAAYSYLPINAPSFSLRLLPAACCISLNRLPRSTRERIACKPVIGKYGIRRFNFNPARGEQARETVVGRRVRFILEDLAEISFSCIRGNAEKNAMARRRCYDHWRHCVKPIRGLGVSPRDTSGKLSVQKQKIEAGDTARCARRTSFAQRI